jgi:hypothetical protein
VLCLAACGSGKPKTVDNRDHDDDSGVVVAEQRMPGSWLPLAPDERVSGKPLRDWAEDWVRWSNEAMDCHEPYSDDDGSVCALGQAPDSPVFFLQMGEVRTHRKRCVVPTGKVIFVPVLGVYDDATLWTGPERSEDQLRANVAAVIQSIRDLTLRFDGETTQRSLDDWSIGGPYLTQYNLPPEPNIPSCYGLHADPGLIQPVFFGGVFVALPAPSPGQHELEYGGAATNPFGVEQRWHVITTFQVE